MPFSFFFFSLFFLFLKPIIDLSAPPMLLLPLLLLLLLLLLLSPMPELLSPIPELLSPRPMPVVLADLEGGGGVTGRPVELVVLRVLAFLWSDGEYGPSSDNSASSGSGGGWSSDTLRGAIFPGKTEPSRCGLVDSGGGLLDTGDTEFSTSAIVEE